MSMSAPLGNYQNFNKKLEFFERWKVNNRNINDNDMKMDENNLYQDNEYLIIVYYNSQLFINLKG